MSKPLLEVKDLTIAPVIGGDPIVKDINFSVEPGKVIALIGESGSGKTTIALSALGYTRPGLEITKGSVRLGDTDVLALEGQDLRNFRGARVSYIAQSAAAAFNPGLSLNYQVTEPNLIHGLMDKGPALDRAKELYRDMKLPNPDQIGDRFPHEVSGGQLQRVMAAMALSTGPELLVFDEPTTALDVTTQISVLKSFKDVIRDRNAAAIYVTHDLAVVAQIADEIIVLLNGQTVEQEGVHDIVSHPQKKYTKILMSASDPDLALAKKESKDPVARDPQEAAALVVDNVTAGYGKIKSNGEPTFPVLKDINMTVPKGTIVGVVGESGSGKSTLARAISGLLPPAKGEVRLNGVALPPGYQQRSKEQLRKVQFVPQMADVALNKSHTISKILGRPVTFMRGEKGAARDDIVADLMDKVKLPRDFMKRLPSQLSGGQKQRVNLARALAANPEVVLCDEVTSALDTVVRNSMIALIDELRETLSLTFFFISHDISTIATLADRTVVMLKGQIVEDDLTEKVMKDPSEDYTKILMGSVPHMRVGWLEDAIAERERIAAGREASFLADA
ncbi:ABC transporter ATP-binding protein [Roseovarius sp. 2305UL8-3]|uniref:ABC transporter ATP-binding protein n=1 Tax=Roseovarius conchicola TaxID=3121636 RepID=UPI0035291424